MPTYAILGTTGKTGGSLLTLLLKDPDNTVNAYVRSKSKLYAQQPQLKDNKSVRVFEGAITDIPLIASCIGDVGAVFVALGENENIPGMRIAQEAAQSVVAALVYARSTPHTTKVPKLVVLSSSSVNERVSANDPPFVHWMLMCALSNVYADLMHAENYYRLHKSWLTVTFMQPGGLVEDEQRGHKLSLDHQKTFISYLDVAAGMIELAQPGTHDWMGVSIVPTSPDVKIERNAPGQLLRGLVWHVAPWVAKAGRSVGLF